MPDRREAILIASTNASRPSKKRILTVCVKLFLEQGYKKTTVAQIVQQASVSNSIFQNIFRAKDGVLTELAQFMLSNQFAMARSTAGTQLPPIYIYAVETAIQMTLTELNENLREIYIEAYTQKEASDYIFRETAKELYQIFSPYQPELTEQDFYFMEIGSAGIMRGFMAHPCDAGKEASYVPHHEPAVVPRPGGRDQKGRGLHRRHGHPRRLRARHARAVQGPCHAL